jgi:hypothetical protein
MVLDAGRDSAHHPRPAGGYNLRENRLHSRLPNFASMAPDGDWSHHLDATNRHFFLVTKKLDNGDAGRMC